MHIEIHIVEIHQLHQVLSVEIFLLKLNPKTPLTARLES